LPPEKEHAKNLDQAINDDHDEDDDSHNDDYMQQPLTLALLHPPDESSVGMHAPSREVNGGPANSMTDV
jgi:hypothetical protein